MERRQFAERLGVTRAAVDLWMKNGIPLLNYRRPARLNDKLLDDVLAAAVALRDQIERSGELWLSVREFARVSGYSQHRVRHYMIRPCPALGGRPIRSVVVKQRNFPRRGQARKKYGAASDARTLAAAATPATPDWIWVMDSARELRCCHERLRRLTQRPLHALGRPLRSARFPRYDIRGNRQVSLYIWRADHDFLRARSDRAAFPTDVCIGERPHVTFRRAAELLGVSVALVPMLVRRGLLTAIVDHSLGASRKGRIGPPPSRFIPLAQVQSLRRRRDDAERSGTRRRVARGPIDPTHN
ncbi:MAG TPA: hypothetical protein VMP01_03030 [Pirellulaceae bacterium]|nr:hypothetical protein [Pirellulaceae bacterium]